MKTANWKAPAEYGLAYLYASQVPEGDAQRVLDDRRAATSAREAALNRMALSPFPLVREMARHCRITAGAAPQEVCAHGISLDSGCGRCLAPKDVTEDVRARALVAMLDKLEGGTR